MIDFQELLDNTGLNFDSLNKKYKIDRRTYNRLINDYKEYLNLPVCYARKIANALGYKFSYLVFLVEKSIAFDCFKEIKEGWDSEVSKELGPLKPIYRYRPILEKRSKLFKEYKYNKDIERVLAVTGHLYTKAKKAKVSRGGGSTRLSAILRENPEIEKQVKESVYSADYYLKLLDEISKEAGYSLNAKDVLETSFLFLNTIV